MLLGKGGKSSPCLLAAVQGRLLSTGVGGGWDTIAVGKAGGRASVSGVCATVFGSTGFVGRYVVNELGKIGSQVVVPYRGCHNDIRHLKLMGDLGQIVPLKYDIRDRDSIVNAIQNSNVVINLIGSKYSTSNYSLDDTNRKIARLIARVSAEQGIERYIHMSDIGADPNSSSEYARLKYAAEEEVLEIMPDATIIRPGPIYGAEDRITNFYASLMRLKFYSPMVAGNHRMTPVYVGDVATGILAAIGNGDTRGKRVELVGPETFTQMEFAAEISELTMLPKATVAEVSLPVAKYITGLLDKLPKHKPRLCHQDVLMREHGDLVASNDPSVYTFQSLGLDKQQALRATANLWLRRFRPVPFMNMVEGEDTYVHDYQDTSSVSTPKHQ